MFDVDVIYGLTEHVIYAITKLVIYTVTELVYAVTKLVIYPVKRSLKMNEDPDISAVWKIWIT